MGGARSRTVPPRPRARVAQAGSFSAVSLGLLWLASCGSAEASAEANVQLSGGTSAMSGAPGSAGSSGMSSGGLGSGASAGQGGRATSGAGKGSAGSARGGTGGTSNTGGAGGDSSGSGGTDAAGAAGVPDATGGSGSTGGAGGSGGSGGTGMTGPVATGTISGFGVDGQPRNWGSDGSAVKPALDLLVKDLGANQFRIEIDKGESYWEKTNDDGDASHFEWSKFDPIFESKDFTDLWDYVRYLNSLGVEEIELAAHGLVPDWMGTNSVATNMEDEYIESLLAVVVYAVTRAPDPKPRFTLFSPWNETDIGPPEGIHLDPPQGVRLLDKLVARMAAIPELDGVGLVAPEASSEAKSIDWRNQLKGDTTALARIRAISFHRYTDYQQTNDWTKADPPQWLTEFNETLDHCYAAKWSNGVGLVANLIGALQFGVTAGLVWTDYDAPHIHDSDAWETFGLLATSYKGSSDLCTTFTTNAPPSTAQLDAMTYAPKPTYQAIKHIFKYVQRGAKLVHVDVSPAGPQVAAYLNPDQSLVVVGEGSDANTFKFQFDTSTTVPASFLPIISTDGKYHQAGSPVSTSGRAVSVKLPANSVFTLQGG